MVKKRLNASEFEQKHLYVTLSAEGRETFGSAFDGRVAVALRDNDNRSLIAIPAKLMKFARVIEQRKIAHPKLGRSRPTRVCKGGTAAQAESQKRQNSSTEELSRCTQTPVDKRFV